MGAQPCCAVREEDAAPERKPVCAAPAWESDGPEEVHAPRAPIEEPAAATEAKGAKAELGMSSVPHADLSSVSTASPPPEVVDPSPPTPRHPLEGAFGDYASPFTSLLAERVPFRLELVHVCGLEGDKLPAAARRFAPGPEECLRVGRKQQTEWFGRLPESLRGTVSREHFNIQAGGGKYLLEGRSDNLTYVDGEAVDKGAQVELRPGALVQIRAPPQAALLAASFGQKVDKGAVPFVEWRLAVGA